MSRQDPLDLLQLSLRTGAAELYVVRHADAVPASDNAFKIYDDYEAHPLSERGRAQAAAVAERLAELNLGAVYASPVRRARETAEAIAAAAGLEVREEPDVTEITIGSTDDSMPLRERLAWLAMIAMRDGSWSGIDGTEPSSQVRARMLRALETIAARHPGERVAIVSHAGAINAALGAIAVSDHDFLFPLANASISVVRVGGGRKLLMSANDTAHLSEIPSRSRA
ncbi:MAG: histidine phosphatase family protein [Candidatus Eremiobacteraeota bacterium]|nr:histidine phosphatase family protein [Candidatus Eremiobacteraeota bacterium]